MDFSHEHRLLGDIGATNVRFALLSNGVLGPIKWFTVADFPRFTDAVTAFLDCEQVSVCEAVLAVAGPVDNDRCVLTNSGWTIDAPELSAAFSFAKVHILNDFEAYALTLPLLTAADLYPVGGGEAVLGAPMAVLGPGTGVGVACFVPGFQSSIVIASEGGHATMAATSDREDAIIDHLRRQFSHVSAEREASGSGLENLYRAFLGIYGIETPKPNAAQITQAPLDRTFPLSPTA